MEHWMGVNKLYVIEPRERVIASPSRAGAGPTTPAVRYSPDSYTQRGELYYELPKSTRATQAIVSLRIVPI